MAQILPPATNLGSDIGRALGQGFQNTFEPAMQQKYQRGLIGKALDEAMKVASNPEAQALDKSIALTKAFAGIPGGERYAANLIPQIISYSERSKGSQPGQPGSIGREGISSNGSRSINQPSSVVDLVPPSSKAAIQDPTAPPSFIAPYNEEQIQQIRQRARQLGYTPEMEERFVQDANEMNQNARAGYQDIQSSYNASQRAREDILNNQEKFRNYVADNAKEFTDPDEMELALKASEKYQGESSFANRLAKVKQEVRPYQALKKGLERTLERPVFGYNKDQLKLAQNNAKSMVDKYGQKDQLRLMIAKGGQGDIEEAKLLNDLPEDFQKKINGFGKFLNPSSFITSSKPDSPEFQKQLEQGNKRFSNQKNMIKNFLSKEIAPGTYKDPGSNLLLIRKNLMDKGLDWSNAGLIIQDAISEGKIKLDPHQEIDYQKLGYPPLSAEDYAQNILNYVIFGKE